MHLVVLVFISNQKVEVCKAESSFINIDVVGLDYKANNENSNSVSFDKSEAVSNKSIVDNPLSIDTQKKEEQDSKLQVFSSEPAENSDAECIKPEINQSNINVYPVRHDNVYSSYVGYVCSRINKVKYYPDSARKNNITGKVKLTFAVRDDGELVYVKLITSSGNTLLDNAAIESVKKASPFMRFPESIKQKEILFNLPITYNIKEK